MAAKTKRTTKPRAAKSVRKSTPNKTATAGDTKKDLVLGLLRRQNGASIAELAEATSWQYHSVRGFLTATIKKKLELPLVSTKAEGQERRYHIAALKPTKE